LLSLFSKKEKIKGYADYEPSALEKSRLSVWAKNRTNRLWSELEQ
jgi:hypothetical protein